jgi:hypothetical protein
MQRYNIFFKLRIFFLSNQDEGVAVIVEPF